jgi:hypothetical protein
VSTARLHLAAVLEQSFGPRYLPVRPNEGELDTAAGARDGQPAAIIAKPLLAGDSSIYVGAALFLEEPHPVTRSALEVAGFFVMTEENPTRLARIVRSVYAANPVPVGHLLGRKQAVECVIADYPETPATILADAAGASAITIRNRRKASR